MRPLIDDHPGSNDSHSEIGIQIVFFLLEITQFAHRMTCFTGHIIFYGYHELA